jgi:hypothetical protein
MATVGGILLPVIVAAGLGWLWVFAREAADREKAKYYRYAMEELRERDERQGR